MNQNWQTLLSGFAERICRAAPLGAAKQVLFHSIKGEFR